MVLVVTSSHNRAVSIAQAFSLGRNWPQGVTHFSAFILRAFNRKKIKILKGNLVSVCIDPNKLLNLFIDLTL